MQHEISEQNQMETALQNQSDIIESLRAIENLSLFHEKVSLFINFLVLILALFQLANIESMSCYVENTADESDRNSPLASLEVTADSLDMAPVEESSPSATEQEQIVDIPVDQNIAVEV